MLAEEKEILRSETAEAPTSRTEVPQRRSNRAGQPPSVPQGTPRSPRRRWVRPALFLLLPLALIAGGYWYVTGGQLMSTDDAYVEADKVGVSTDVSGIVKEVDVTENQHVEAGQVLYRLDDLPFRLALDRAEAQVGMVGDALNALKANYRDMQAQIKEAQNDIDYFDDGIPPSAGPRERACRVSVDLRHGAPKPAERPAEVRLSRPAARRDRRQPQRRSRRPGRAATPAISTPWRSATRRRANSAHTVVRAPFAGIVTNVPSIAPGKYLPASTTAFYLVAADHVWVDANPKETELTYVRSRAAGHGDGRHLSRCAMGRDGREHQPGGGPGVLAAAGAEHQRQLGEGRAAHSRCACASTRATRTCRRCAPG